MSMSVHIAHPEILPDNTDIIILHAAPKQIPFVIIGPISLKWKEIRLAMDGFSTKFEFDVDVSEYSFEISTTVLTKRPQKITLFFKKKTHTQIPHGIKKKLIS